MAELDQELVHYLITQGHSADRAVQIAGNHPDAVRAEMEAHTEKEKEGATQA